LIKIGPIINVFDWFKQRALNFTRVMEMLFLYYCAAHIFACSLIKIAYTQDDINSTWLRRLPVLQSEGFRTKNDFSGLSDSSIYIHALNFIANTMSHLAIGEISMVNASERIYNAFIIL
jgi:hypothetical protein